VLALDTTGDPASLALIENGRLVDERIIESQDGYAHVLHDHLRALLARHRWNIAGIGCFAAAAGPASFTGVRVGLAAVKGLAEVGGRPVVAVSNLRALAWFGSGPLRAAVIDARRGEIYGGVYDGSGRLVMPETVAPPPEWLASLPDVEFVTARPDQLRAMLAGTRHAESAIHAAPPLLARAVGAIAFAEWVSGGAADPVAVDANYVRPWRPHS